MESDEFWRRLDEALIPEEDINLDEEDPVDLSGDPHHEVGSSIEYTNTLDYPVVLEVLEPVFGDGKDGSKDFEDKESAKEFRFYSNKEQYWFKYYGFGEVEPKTFFLIRPDTEEVINFTFPGWVLQKSWDRSRKTGEASTLRLRFKLHTKVGVKVLLSRKIFLK